MDNVSDEKRKFWEQRARADRQRKWADYQSRLAEMGRAHDKQQRTGRIEAALADAKKNNAAANLENGTPVLSAEKMQNRPAEKMLNGKMQMKANEAGRKAWLEQYTKARSSKIENAVAGAVAMNVLDRDPGTPLVPEHKTRNRPGEKLLTKQMKRKKSVSSGRSM